MTFVSAACHTAAVIYKKALKCSRIICDEDKEILRHKTPTKPRFDALAQLSADDPICGVCFLFHMYDIPCAFFPLYQMARTEIVIVQELGSGSKEMCFHLANAFCWNECF